MRERPMTESEHADMMDALRRSGRPMTNPTPPTSAASVEAMRKALKDAASTFEVLQEHLKDDPKLADELPVDLHVAIHETMLACRALSTPAEKPAGREAEIEQAARAISLSYGEDPDDVAPLGKICGPNNEPMPNWTAYREQAAAALSSFSTPAEAGREARKAAETAASTVISALGDPVKHDAAITAIAAQFEAFALARALSTTGRDAAAPTSEWQDISTVPVPPRDWNSDIPLEASEGPAVAYRDDDENPEPLFLVYWSEDGPGASKVTHWAPLPAAPASPNATSQGGENTASTSAQDPTLATKPDTEKEG